MNPYAASDDDVSSTPPAPAALSGASSEGPRPATLPVVVNAGARQGERIAARLARVPGLAVRLRSPSRIGSTIRALLDEGAPRIALAGGDGTLRNAVSSFLDASAELALIPAGTLNHFARTAGIPLEAEAAARLARDGTAVPVDIGVLAGEPFLNFSSLGAYPLFVRLRHRMEPRLGYTLASAVALMRMVTRLRAFDVDVEVDGARKRYRSPLVLVAVGERTLPLAQLWRRAPNGERALHVLVVHGRPRRQLAAMARAAVARQGALPTLESSAVESQLARHCTVRPRGRARLVGADGELLRMQPPLEYRYAAGALRVVLPRGESGDQVL